MKAKSIIVPVLVGILMAFTVVPMMAYADSYDLTVGSEMVTSDNAFDILGNGTVSYTAANKKLTLNNATITGGINSINIKSNISDLTIEVNGENKLIDGDIGILSSQRLTITGNGSLQVDSSNQCIGAFDAMTIKKTTVTATGGMFGIKSTNSVMITDSTVTAKATGDTGSGILANGLDISGNSTVHAYGKTFAINGGNEITIGKGLGLTKPKGGLIVGGHIYGEEGSAISVTIEKLTEMNGDGTEDSPYEIKSYADLKEFESIVNGSHEKRPVNRAACGKLMNDIICTDKKWTPINNVD